MALKTLLVDIGNVLVGLNYERPLSTIRHFIGLPKEEIQARLDRCPDLDLYETEKLGTDEFWGYLNLLSHWRNSRKPGAASSSSGRTVVTYSLPCCFGQ